METYKTMKDLREVYPNTRIKNGQHYAVRMGNKLLTFSGLSFLGKNACDSESKAGDHFERLQESEGFVSGDWYREWEETPSGKYVYWCDVKQEFLVY